MQLSASDRKLKWYHKLVFALGEFAPSVAVGTVLPFYFLFFLTDVAGVRPGVAGTILLVARIWDAVNDPLVGVLSDRTRSQLGRRRPYMLAGAVPMAVLYMLLWFVPPLATSGARAMYYLGVYLLFDLAYTLVSGPYYALTPEMSLDTDERTSIVTYRAGLSIVTGLLAAVALPFVFEAAGSMQVAFQWAGIGIGLISMLPYFLLVALVRERADFQSARTTDVVRSVRVLLRNRAFWLSLLLNGLAWLAIAMVEAVFAYFLIYWAKVSEANTPIFLATILASATVFLPVVNWLAGRYEKKWAFVIATSVWAVLHVALWWVPAAAVVPVFIVAVLAGLGISAAHVLPAAMGADALESVEYESGERQEGVFGGLSGFIQKLGTSLALASVGWVLELTGYQPNAAAQAPAALLGIRALTTWVPAALLVAAIAAAAAFPITRSVHRALNEELARRRAARRDPRAPLDAG